MEVKEVTVIPEAEEKKQPEIHGTKEISQEKEAREVKVAAMLLRKRNRFQ